MRLSPLSRTQHGGVSRETPPLAHLFQAWWYFVIEADTHLERAVLVFTAPRALLLLPFVQSRFSPAVGQFTNRIPQWAWAIFAFWICSIIWSATARPLLLRRRIRAMKWAGAHWLAIGGLLIMGDPTALAGWYYVLACTIPLAAICRLAPPKPPPNDGAPTQSTPTAD